MITLQFPKINKTLVKNIKDEPDNSPLRGVIVLNQKAIVYNHFYCIVVDLYDYFTIECGISDPDELLSLEGILMYMNSKVFSDQYWNELTAGANMEMTEGSLFVDTPRFSKGLHYKELEINIILPLERLFEVRHQNDDLIQSTAFSFSILNKIYSMASTDFKTDDIIFDFSGKSQYVKFTFKKNKHFYGYIKPNFAAAEESFKYENLNSFVDEFEEYLKSLKSELPAPPPPIISSEEETNIEIVDLETEKNLFNENE